MNDFISMDFSYAVVGASNNMEKYGYKVFKYLLESGYKVIPVNLNDPEIQGQKAYKSVLDYSEKIDVVFVVIPPESTEILLNDIHEKGIDKVWFQPGSSNPNVVNIANSLGLKYMNNTCILQQNI